MTATSARQVTVCASPKGGQGCTTIAAARATATAIGSRRAETHVESLQEYYAREARG